MKLIAIVMIFALAAVVFGDKSAGGRKQFGICTTDEDCPSGTICTFPGNRGENAAAKICKVAVTGCGIPAPANAYVCDLEGTDINDTAKVLCHAGYSNGRNTRMKCLETGDWDDSAECLELDQLPICGGILSDGDTFTSPNYPNDYNKHDKCTWTMVVPAGRSAKLSFQAFDVSGEMDFLMVATCDRIIGAYYGKIMPANITVTDFLHVYFMSDLTTSPGFSATVTLI